jgi:hypothetical protein
MDLSALDSEDKVQLSDSEEQDFEVSDLNNEDLGSDHESHEDEDFQELGYDDDDKETDYEGVEAAGSALPTAFDRLRVSDSRSFNSFNSLTNYRPPASATYSQAEDFEVASTINAATGAYNNTKKRQRRTSAHTSGSIDSREPPFNGTYSMFNKFISLVGQRKIERYILEAIDFDLQISVLDTGCVSLETLKRLDRTKAMRYNFSRIYLHLIWDTTLSNVYWLYVGASHHVASRIRNHIVSKYARSLSITRYGRCLAVTIVGSCWLAAGTWVLKQLMNHRCLVC